MTLTPSCVPMSGADSLGRIAGHERETTTWLRTVQSLVRAVRRRNGMVAAGRGRPEGSAGGGVLSHAVHEFGTPEQQDPQCREDHDRFPPERRHPEMCRGHERDKAYPTGQRAEWRQALPTKARAAKFARAGATEFAHDSRPGRTPPRAGGVRQAFPRYTDS